MPKPFASLSLDLDNQWSFMKTHGDAGWESFPSYFDIVCPRVVDFLEARDLTITFFIVGQDAALEENHDALALLSKAGHEIANHSFHHEPWLHLYSHQEVKDELQRAEDAIAHATGVVPIGFRGPGFSVSPTVYKVLSDMGYAYDASTLPTFLGPLARAYYFMTSDLEKEELKKRNQLFGKFSEGFRTLHPYPVTNGGANILEIPVTTMPLFKVPFHLSYILYLGCYSKWLAMTYFRFALMMCRIMRVEPSLLLHPLDFMGADDNIGLDFFPAMNMQSAQKCELAGEVIDYYRSTFQVGTMKDHALRCGGLMTDKETAEGRLLASQQSDINPPLVGARSATTED